MDQVQDFYYCCEPKCEAPLKMIRSLDDQLEHHNTHKLGRISQLRSELKVLYTDNSLKDYKDELLSLID